MDPAAEWYDAQQRVIDLVQSLSPETLEQLVPACPAWTIRQLFAHMIGVGADFLADNVDDDHGTEWTRRQVDARADHDVDTLVTEWKGMAEAIQDWMRSNSPAPLGDVTIHEQDLYEAVGVEGTRDSAGLAAIRDRLAGRFVASVEAAGLAPVAMLSPTWSQTPDQPGLQLEASEYDLTRALMSRRSAQAIRGWTTAGDPTAYLPCFAGLGPLPETGEVTL